MHHLFSKESQDVFIHHWFSYEFHMFSYTIYFPTNFRCFIHHIFPNVLKMFMYCSWKLSTIYSTKD